MADFGATISSVSETIGAAGRLISSGPASALSSVGGAVGDALSAVGNFFKPVKGVKLPLANPLFAYASYDYVIGIGAITDAQLANPDKTYMKGEKIKMICKTANMEPNNRIKTAYGAFDFFVDKLDIQSSIGLEKGSNTNVLSFNFTIIEPYSMGIFLMALQQAAWDVGHDNYLDAPYLLTIDFRGNTETGTMANIPNTSRKIPFKFRSVGMSVTEKGSTYQCEAYPFNAPALGSAAKMKTDVSIKGKTVQEVLQTGEKSLQSVLNKRLQQLKADKIVEVPDEILILFPENVASEGSDGNKSDNKDTSKGVKTATVTTGTADDIGKILGVVRSDKNKTLIQTEAACNQLGKAKVGFDELKQGDAPGGKDNKVYDPAKKVNVRGNNIIDPETGDFRFSQDTDVMNAINQVLMNSDYVKTALSQNNITDEGYRKWWRIETQVYNISSNANYKKTGTKPKLIVYRIVPYNVHTSKVMPPNTKAPGLQKGGALQRQAVKEYNYIYTGKNVDIISFNIDFKVNFAGVMGSAKLSRTQDAKLTGSASGTEKQVAPSQPMPEGNEPEKKPGALPTRVNYDATKTKTDGKGGGGLESETTQAARMFHDSVTAGADMMNLDMKIIGDPYYIAQSGQGNYTSAPTQYANLNSDGSVNYQNGEVDIVVNFRTPIDINQTTGLYDFGKSSKSAPVLQWSGMYQVISVASSFSGGQFTQVLTGSRRPNQELTKTATAAQTYNSTNNAPPGAAKE